jgi:hypothetical protein
MGKIFVAAQLAKFPMTCDFNQTIGLLGAPQVE